MTIRPFSMTWVGSPGSGSAGQSAPLNGFKLGLGDDPGVVADQGPNLNPGDKFFHGGNAREGPPFFQYLPGETNKVNQNYETFSR